MHTAPLQTLRDAPTSDQRESSGRRALAPEAVPASRLESSQDLSLHGDPRDLQTPSEQLQGRGRPTRDRTPHLSRVSPPGPKPAASPGGAQEAAATERRAVDVPGASTGVRAHRGLRQRLPKRPARPPGRAGAPRAAGDGTPWSHLLSRHRTDQTSGTDRAGQPRSPTSCRAGPHPAPHPPCGGHDSSLQSRQWGDLPHAACVLSRTAGSSHHARRPRGSGDWGHTQPARSPSVADVRPAAP